MACIAKFKQAFKYAFVFCFCTLIYAEASFPVAFSSTNAQIRDFLQTENAKLVYIDYWEGEYQLKYIDFSEGDGEGTIHSIAAAAGLDGPKLPVISPDGNWVVYTKGSGGEAGSSFNSTSEVFVCRLSPDATPIKVSSRGFEPRWLFNAPQPTLVFPTYGFNLGWEDVISSGGQDVENPATTVLVELSQSGNTLTASAPQVLVEGAAYTGGVSPNNQYITGGGGLVAMYDLSSPQTSPDTVGPIDFGKPEAISGQACNASMSASTLFPGMICYLDFGSRGKTYQGINDNNPWQVWQVIHVTNYQKQVVAGFGYPINPTHPYETIEPSFTGAKWHHPEWSNHPYFLTATVNVDRYFSNPDPSGIPFVNTANQERVYVINAKDSTYLEVLRQQESNIVYKKKGGGLYWPGLWIEIPENFSEKPGWLPVSTKMPNRKSMPGYRHAAVQVYGSIVKSTLGISQVHIFKVNGQKVFSQYMTGTSNVVKVPEINQLPSGIYYLVIESKDGVELSTALNILHS